MNNDLSRALKKSKIVSTFSITNKSKIVNPNHTEIRNLALR